MSSAPPRAPADDAVALADVSFTWPGAAAPTLAGLDLSIGRGERVFVVGPSGSGKTTLLSLIGGVLVPDAGRVTVDGVDLGALGGAERDAFRADRIGFVFQQFNLLPFLPLAANVALPCRFSAERRRRAGGRAALETEAWRLLERLGLARERFDGRSVAALSVGQQQRVAVARALIGRPAVVIADEPTSALDADARDEFLALLADEVRAVGATLLFVSHDAALAERFDRRIDLASMGQPDEVRRSRATDDGGAAGTRDARPTGGDRAGGVGDPSAHDAPPER